MNDFNRLYAPPSYIDSQGNLLLNDTKVVNYILDEQEKSKNFLRSNRGWRSADSCMSILYGDENPRQYSKLSSLTIKKQRRQVRETIANASNIRPRWKTQTAKKEYQEIATIYNKRRDGWFYSEFIDRFIKEALQWGGGAGTGYLMLWPEWDWNKNKIEIKPKVLSHKNVFPFHAAADSRIETLYGICAWFEMPVPEAHRKFPEHLSILQADRDVPSYFASRFEKVKRKWRGVADWITNNKQKGDWIPYPVCDVFYSWICDDSINETGRSLHIGDVNAHYSYRVHSLVDLNGKPNKINKREIIESEDNRYDETNSDGSSKYRLITRKECKLFPYRRLIISTRIGVIYDGPPMWICRRPPITIWKFEEIVGEWLGIPLARDGRGLERSLNNLIRSIEDSVVGKLQPPIGVDSNLPAPIAGKLAGNVRLLIGKVFKYNTNFLAKAIVPLLPWEYFSIDSRVLDIIKYLQEMLDYLMGSADYTAWQRLKQLPAADTQESMIQSLGILATDHERSIERSILEMGEIWQDFAPQVYTTFELVNYLGADGISERQFDFDPDSLLPQSDPDDDRSFAERLQDHMKIFSLYAAPHSLQERMSITNKLTLMQLKKQGVPISDKKLYEAFVEDGGYEESLKEYNAEQQAKILQAAELQRKLQEANQQSDPHNQLTDKLATLIHGQGNGEGRPATNNAPPRLESKTRDGVPGDPTVASN